MRRPAGGGRLRAVGAVGMSLACLLPWTAACATRAPARTLEPAPVADNDTATFDGEAAWRSAEAAFSSHDFSAAEAGYLGILRASGPQPHRMAALLDLATIAWRVRGDTARARDFLRRGILLDTVHTDFTHELGRMRLANHESARAAALAREARERARGESEGARATVLLAEALLQPFTDRLDRDPIPRNLSADEERAVRESRDMLVPLVRARPGELQPARLLILAASLAGDGGAVMEAIRSYYVISVDLTGSGPLALPYRALASMPTDWAKGALPLDEQSALVDALAGLRFFEAAAFLACRPSRSATAPFETDSRAAEVVAYARFYREVTDLTERFYQETAAGRGGSVDDLRGAFLTAATGLWNRVSWGDRTTPPSEDSVQAVLGRRFGTFYSLGLTSGYPSLHMGHVVVDDHRVVRQLGREASVRFVSLDAVVSNGFQTWAWDGRASTGGWGTGTTIVQIRPSYAEGPLYAWRLASDSATVARLARRISADSARDARVARSTPVAYFPGVEERLLRDARSAIIDSLRAAGLSGRGLEAAFKHEYARAELESSVFAHEGRHAIDQSFEPGLSSEELEFRAKVAQVMFGPRPRVGAVSGIIQANIGDGTPHGEANRRIMEGLVRWMESHAAEIPALDPANPLLPQLPRLSAEQLRSAFASMATPAGQEGPQRRLGGRR